VGFNVASAGWYLETLRQIYAGTGDLDRFIGVEMALVGFLSGVSSAFDAAVAALIEAIEYSLPPASKTPQHKYKWKACMKTAASLTVHLSCSVDVDIALAGDGHPIPTGWLAVARRMRNRSTHQSTLSRQFSRALTEDLRSGASGGYSSPTMVSLPDGTGADPLQWCEQTLTSISDLVTAICTDLATVLSQQGR